MFAQIMQKKLNDTCQYNYVENNEPFKAIIFKLSGIKAINI